MREKLLMLLLATVCCALQVDISKNEQSCLDYVKMVAKHRERLFTLKMCKSTEKDVSSYSITNIHMCTFAIFGL